MKAFGRPAVAGVCHEICDGFLARTREVAK
jgi:hypothetical protein